MVLTVVGGELGHEFVGAWTKDVQCLEKFEVMLLVRCLVWRPGGRFCCTMHVLLGQGGVRKAPSPVLGLREVPGVAL